VVSISNLIIGLYGAQGIQFTTVLLQCKGKYISITKDSLFEEFKLCFSGSAPPLGLLQQRLQIVNQPLCSCTVLSLLLCIMYQS
jgi:hypothetical protein